MNLKEEYFLRNGIKINPILFNHNTYLIVSKENDYRSIDFKWCKSERYPGFFTFNYVQFNKFSRKKLIYGMKSLSRQEVPWEEYEDFVIDLSKSLIEKRFNAINQLENPFVMWKIFLKMTDSCIAQELDIEGLQRLKMSIDKSLSIDERMNFVYDIIEKLDSFDSSLLGYWHAYFQRVFEQSSCIFEKSKWLFNIINKK